MNISEKRLKLIITAYTLKNSVANNGKPNANKIFNSVMGHLKKEGVIYNN